MESKALPLYQRFPALAELPRVPLGQFPSPVDRVSLMGGVELWLKRDDRNAPTVGGNKVRALEFLLAGVQTGDLVRTAGGEGSTHVYATAVHARRLGARTAAVRWPQVMHPLAFAVAREAERHCETAGPAVWMPLALAQTARWWVAGQGVEGRRRYVPIGGSSPLGVLGHVNAGLELAEQVARGDLPEPTHVVVPLGSGGTVAGLALGLGIAGLRTQVVGARVAPRVVANIWRVRGLIVRTRRLIRRAGRVRSELRAAPVTLDHSVYGGAYGRPLAAGAGVAALLNQAVAGVGGARVILDATYGAKAAAVAVALAGHGDPGGAGQAGNHAIRRVLLWVTFDGRALGEGS